jgi:hypothetical protein
LRVIPTAKFIWEGEEDDLEHSPRRTSLLIPGSPLQKTGTMGFGEDSPAATAPTGSKKLEKKKVLRRGTPCARCSYIMGRIITEHGRRAQILMLFMAGVVSVVVLGFGFSIVWRDEREPYDDRDPADIDRYQESLWIAWIFMADGGTHAKVFHAGQRFAGGLIAVCGIIYLAAVLAFVVDMVREKMNAMRVGKGQVYEKGHVVILHWSDRTIPLLHEMCIANESDGGGVVVILAKESMETMQMELSAQLPKSIRHGTKIVCRYGSPAVLSDLMKVSVDTAKAIVILAHGKQRMSVTLTLFGSS